MLKFSINSITDLNLEIILNFLKRMLVVVGVIYIICAFMNDVECHLRYLEVVLMYNMLLVAHHISFFGFAIFCVLFIFSRVMVDVLCSDFLFGVTVNYVLCGANTIRSAFVQARPMYSLV